VVVALAFVLVAVKPYLDVAIDWVSIAAGLALAPSTATALQTVLWIMLGRQYKAEPKVKSDSFSFVVVVFETLPTRYSAAGGAILITNSPFVGRCSSNRLFSAEGI